MKITKRQLRRIIREEKQKLISEMKIRKIIREELEDQVSEKVFKVRPQGRYFYGELQRYFIAELVPLPGQGPVIYVRDSVEELEEIMKALGAKLIGLEGETLVEPGIARAKYGDFVGVDSRLAEGENPDVRLMELIEKFKLTTATPKAPKRKRKSKDPMYQEIFDLVLMGVLDSYEADQMEQQDPGSWEYQIERIRDELGDMGAEYNTVLAAIKDAKKQAKTKHRQGESVNVNALADFEDGVIRF